MKVFTVNTDVVGGRFSKTYKRGQIVKAIDFQPGIADQLERKGMLKLYSNIPEQIVKSKKVEVNDVHVNSQNVEFGYELLSALPYAYHLYLQGKLLSTESGVDTSCLYWFSPKHTENNKQRGWHNMERASNIPNIRIHQPSLDWSVWSPPPLRERYENRRFVWKKPTLCICNRINVEWDKGVINYFDEQTLDKLFSELSGDYHIVYFNIEGRPEFYDGVKPVAINDIELCRKYGVDVIHDLAKDNPDLTFNELQLMIMANCKMFITMNGGYGILASYMGGTNIIYSKECKEITPKVNSFYRWYHKLGDSRIIHVNTYEGIFQALQYTQQPLVNILIRTHRRPKYFNCCMESIYAQTYKNIRVFVGYHDNSSDRYLIEHKITPVPYQAYDTRIERKNDLDNYGAPFHSNHYLNHLSDELQNGFVILLDDDDRFTSNTAVEQIVNAINGNPNAMVCWRIYAMGRTIPSDTNWKQQPQPRDISGISMCMPVHVFKQHKFEPYRLGDYRLAKWIWPKVDKVFIDEKFTEMISGTCNMGRGNDL